MRTQIILFTLLFASLCAIGQVRINHPYEFPIKPGSLEWGTLSTGQEMVNVCQIPDSILLRLSTQALAQTCLNYPLFFQHTASNDERKAISGMIKGFNGLSELAIREDGLKELIKLYRNIPDDKTAYLQTKAEDVPYKTIYIELLLSDDQFIGKAKAEDLKEIKWAYLKKYSGKLKNQNVHSLYCLRKTFLLGAITTLKLDSKDSKKKEEIKRFINRYDVAQSDELTSITKIITQL